MERRDRLSSNHTRERVAGCIAIARQTAPEVRQIKKSAVRFARSAISIGSKSLMTPREEIAPAAPRRRDRYSIIGQLRPVRPVTTQTVCAVRGASGTNSTCTR